MTGARKKILFYSIYHTCEPVFASEMEVMAKHIKNGDEVYVLRCHGELKYCDLNPEYRQDICFKCEKSFYQNIELIGLNKNSVIKIPKVAINYDKIPKKFQNIEELRNFSLDGIRFGLCTASTLISEYKEHKLDTFKHREKIYRLLKTSYFTYKFIKKVFSELKPDVFYHQGGRVANIYPAYKAADELGIERYSITDAGVMSKYDLFKNFTMFDFDGIAKDIDKLWQKKDDKKAEKASKWYIDKKDGLDVEWSSFTKDQQRNLLPQGFNEEKRNIAIFNSSINEYCAVEGGENTLYEDETQALRKLLECFKNNEEIHFYLRIHPNLKNQKNTQISDLREIASKNYKNLTIIWPEEKIDTYALLFACEKTIVFFSTMGAEACFWEKPSILVGRALHESLDCCYKPKTHEEFMELVERKLEPKNKIEALKYGYWQFERGYEFKMYKPDSHFGGVFLGVSMKPKISLLEEMQIKIIKRKSRLVRKIAKFLAKYNILF